MKLALLLLLAFAVVLLLPRPAPRAGQQQAGGHPAWAGQDRGTESVATAAVSPRSSLAVRARVAQSVERHAEDVGVAGSIPAPGTISRVTPAPVAAAESAGPRGAAPTLSGIASWYPGSRGFVGTPHAAIPGGRWTGRINGWAVVCAFVPGHDPCLTVPLVDFCACRVGSSRRDIDLSIDAVRALGLDPARGLYRISLEVLR